MSKARDPRWTKLEASSFLCASCGETHKGLFHIGYDRPFHWNDGDAKPNGDLDGLDHLLTEDLCIVEGRDYFVRCRLRLPLIGAESKYFEFGVWSSLAPANFSLFAQSFEGGEQGLLGPWFGWLSNRLPGYPETLNLKCRVQPQDGRMRPLIELEPSLHPLSVEHREGIDFDRLMQIYADHGHDVAAALSPY